MSERPTLSCGFHSRSRGRSVWSISDPPRIIWPRTVCCQWRHFFRLVTVLMYEQTPLTTQRVSIAQRSGVLVVHGIDILTSRCPWSGQGLEFASHRPWRPSGTPITIVTLFIVTLASFPTSDCQWWSFFVSCSPQRPDSRRISPPEVAL